MRSTRMNWIEPREKLRSHGVQLRAPSGVGNLDHQGLLLLAQLSQHARFFRPPLFPAAKSHAASGSCSGGRRFNACTMMRCNVLETRSIGRL